MRTEISSECLLSETALERCRSYVVLQLKDRKTRFSAGSSRRPGPAITISREAGCGVCEIAEQVAHLLQEAGPKGRCVWTVFDRQLIEKVLEEHNLPRDLAKYIPEDRRSYLQDTIEELLGLRPPSWKIVPQIVETILHLLEMGHVIIVGRGANVIAARTPNVFHVRLVAPLEQRIDYVRQANKLARKEAARWIEKEDRGRARYVKSHFKCRIDDPMLYHVVIDTGRMSYADAAEMIAEGARKCFDGEGASVA